MPRIYQNFIKKNHWIPLYPPQSTEFLNQKHYNHTLWCLGHRKWTVTYLFLTFKKKIWTGETKHISMYYLQSNFKNFRQIVKFNRKRWINCKFQHRVIILESSGWIFWWKMTLNKTYTIIQQQQQQEVPSTASKFSVFKLKYQIFSIFW